MRALNYVGPFKVKVEDVEKPKLEHPEDVIVKVTTVSLYPDHSTATETDLNSRLPFAAPIYSRNGVMAIAYGERSQADDDTQYVRRADRSRARHHLR